MVTKEETEEIRALIEVAKASIAEAEKDVQRLFTAGLTDEAKLLQGELEESKADLTKLEAAFPVN